MYATGRVDRTRSPLSPDVHQLSPGAFGTATGQKVDTSFINKTLVEKIEPHIDKSKVKGWSGLRIYNMILFVIHIVIAIFLLIYFAKIRKSSTPVAGINLDLFNHAFTLNSDGSFYQVVSEKVLSVSEGGVETLIITFFAITAGFHLLYALNPGNIYLNAISKGNNFLRWIEYSISATIMIVIIALLSGVKDYSNYILLVVSSIAIMSTGQWFETATGKSKWIPIVIGFIVLAGVFATIFYSFRKRLQEAKASGFKVPAWLYATVWVLFAFYASFGFVPIAQMIFKGDYVKYEYAYLTLSLLSKASLGILVAVGFGARSQSQQPS